MPKCSSKLRRLLGHQKRARGLSSSLLFEVKPTNPITCVGVVFTFRFVVLAALLPETEPPLSPLPALGHIRTRARSRQNRAAFIRLAGVQHTSISSSFSSLVVTLKAA